MNRHLGSAALALQAGGTIATINPEHRVVTLERREDGGRLPLGKAEAFVVTPQSAISDRGGQGLQLHHLKPGDEVTIRYSEQDGRNVASAVILQGWRMTVPRPGEERTRLLKPTPLEEPLSTGPWSPSP
jgi:hypothetical protein